jgi:serine protease DegS
MQLTKLIQFIFQFITIGIAVAFVIIILKPELIQKTPETTENHNRIVEIQDNSTAGIASNQVFSYSNAVGKAAPAVVSIYTAKVMEQQLVPDHPLTQRFFRNLYPETTRKRIETSLGSGVIFSPQGYILTNHHVIADATEIQVMLHDGRSVSAQVAGSDPETDIAVLKINLQDLPSITIGNSQSVRVGDVVLAIGNPYGVGQTVTQGIVSATDRNRVGLNTFENFIQTDAAINPGNSGGSLINPYGELIGINSAIFSRSGGSQGIGFAIPVNLARKVMTDIIEHGHVIRGWLGVRMNNLTRELVEAFKLKDPYGVVITGVIKDSPAVAAGLRAGDVLLKINNQPVLDVRSILDLISQQKPDTKITIEGIRNTKPFNIMVTVTQRPHVFHGHK